MSALAPTLQAFFTERLIRQHQASAHTIAAYRDTWRLLLGYASQHTGVPPSALDLAHLDAPLIAGFLDHLQRERANSARTRTPDWPRSAHCSASPPSLTPSTPTRSPGCWRSRRNPSIGR
jgi:hypothetical protein